MILFCLLKTRQAFQLTCDLRTAPSLFQRCIVFYLSTPRGEISERDTEHITYTVKTNPCFGECYTCFGYCYGRTYIKIRIGGKGQQTGRCKVSTISVRVGRRFRQEDSGWQEAESLGRSTDQHQYLYRLKSFFGRPINRICKYSAGFRQSNIYPIYLTRVGFPPQNETKTGVVRILAVFPNRPMFSHINGKLSPSPFKWYGWT